MRSLNYWVKEIEEVSDALAEIARRFIQLRFKNKAGSAFHPLIILYNLWSCLLGSLDSE